MNPAALPQRLALFAALFALALSTLACSFGGIELGRDTATITIDLSQSQLDLLFNHTTSVDVDRDEELLDNVTDVELHDGYLRVFGEYTAPNGDRKTGSYDVALKADHGELKAQVIGVDIEGLDLQDPRIAKMNADMETGLVQSTRDSHGEVIFKEVAVTKDRARMVIEVQMDERKER